jgi:8-hydroxy-5-deazaflavin:NADPH oxidoreductase
MLSFSKDMAKLRDSANSLGAKAGTPAEAGSFGELIVLATPWTAAADALKQVGVMLGNKILWDCTNALKPDMSGLPIGTTTSGGEEVAKLAPWARVVKAIPPFPELPHSPSMLVGGSRSAGFVCSDDAEGRRAVGGLVRDIGRGADRRRPSSPRTLYGTSGHIACAARVRSRIRSKDRVVGAVPSKTWG